jgi:hypothetical protein
MILAPIHAWVQYVAALALLVLYAPRCTNTKEDEMRKWTKE